VYSRCLYWLFGGKRNNDDDTDDDNDDDDDIHLSLLRCRLNCGRGIKTSTSKQMQKCTRMTQLHKQTNKQNNKQPSVWMKSTPIAIFTSSNKILIQKQDSAFIELPNSAFSELSNSAFSELPNSAFSELPN
jgi:hypothetical protein